MNGLEDIKPVFIVGMNGSGTTLLLDCLNNHPNVFGFRRETKIIPNYVADAKQNGSLEDDDNCLRLWNNIRQEYVFKVVNGGKPIPLPQNWRQLPRNPAFVFHYVFMHFARKEGKSRWCEKTPDYALHMNTIKGLFPAAKFIHIVRDGRACAASLHRRYGYPPELMMYRWKNTVRSARRQASLIGEDNCIEIHFEEFTRDPATWMEKLCAFIDEPFSSATVTSSRIRRFTGNRNRGVVFLPEKWREEFDDDLLERLEKIGGKLLHELGYPSESACSDYDPPKPILLYWMYYGYAKGTGRTIARDIRSKGFGKKWHFFQSLSFRLRSRWKV